MSLALPIQILLVMAAAVFGVFLLIKLLMLLGWAIGQIFGAVGNVFGRVGSFIGGEVSDALRLVGGVITAAMFVPPTVFNIALGRWSRANHFGHALEEEALGVGKAAYRIGLGHPARLLGLTHITDGVEKRLPDVMRRAPGRDRPSGSPDAFDGYKVVGALPSGGSGARLWLAEPSEDKRTSLVSSGISLPEKVVIKSFSLIDGSTLPQIVRESRALQSARKLGLVFEHELTSSRFHYVMPFVPGDDLTVVTQRIHAEAPARGLEDRQVRQVLGYMADLLRIMDRFHQEGLWHKDIKPSNIIVSDGRVQLVDLGLITPLQSAMTLTTHGTEYFRDPELVRLALRGVKVNEVDGVKFDIYGAGAVFHSMLENSFPAHGSLSQITKACPEAVRWMIRRAMADIDQRYSTTHEMLADVEAVMAAPKLNAFAPAQLPSMGGPAQPRPRSGFFAKVSFGRGAKGAENTLADEAAQAAASTAELASDLRTSFDFPESTAAAPQPQSREERREARHMKRSLTAATRKHGGVRWGAVIAAMFLIGFLGVGVLSLAGARSTSFSNTTTWHDIQHATPAPSQLRSIPHKIVAGAKDAARATRDAVRSAFDNGQSSGSVTSRSIPAPRAPKSSLRSLALGMAGSRPSPHRVLVLDDVPPGARESVDHILTPALESFEQARFEIVGLGRTHQLSALTHETLEAEARAVVGLSSPEDPQAVQRLEEFVALQDDLDAILWLARGDTEDEVLIDLIAHDETDRQDGQSLLTAAVSLR